MLATKYYYNDDSILNYYDHNKELHREDGPAIEHADGSKAWYIDGKRHRMDGPAIEYANGGKEWWVDGKRHKEDGPAVEWSNDGKDWYVNGKLHRIDGPAVEWSDGYKAWWVDGNVLTEKEFNNHPKVQNYRFQALLEEVLSEQ